MSNGATDLRWNGRICWVRKQVASGDSSLNTVVLLSGGMDSTACLEYYLELGHHIRAIFVDYGHPANPIEYFHAQRIAQHYGLSLDRANFTGPKGLGPGEIQGRNAFFIFSALLYYQHLKGLVALGIHAGTRYYDCSPSFFSQIGLIVASYTNGQVQVDAPFLQWDKQQIWAYCKEHGVALDLTYSCEKGEAIPCGLCLSCRDRSRLGVC